MANLEERPETGVTEVVSEVDCKEVRVEVKRGETEAEVLASRISLAQLLGSRARRRISHRRSTVPPRGRTVG